MATEQEKLRILVIGAHPADVFDNAGGTLAHHIARGDTVTALALTQGARIHDVVISEGLRNRVLPAEELDKLIEERTRVKHGEVREACAILGVTDVRFLTYTDAVMMVTEELVEATARLIREVRPHIVITHYPYENGGIANQHAITGQISIFAIDAAGGVGRGDTHTPWRVAQVFFMATPMGLHRATILGAEPIAHPDVYIDITDVIVRKVQALDCLKSQQYDGAYARKRAEGIDGAFGRFLGVPYAEAFISYRPQLYYHLPIGPWAVERANEMEGEKRARTDVFLAPGAARR